MKNALFNLFSQQKLLDFFLNFCSWLWALQQKKLWQPFLEPDTKSDKELMFSVRLCFYYLIAVLYSIR
jgi:hypothetical protein